MLDATLQTGLERIDQQRARCARYRQHWSNQAPAAFLSPDARDALDRRLQRLSVNFPRLVVSSHANRLALAGITHNGELAADVWERFQQAGGGSVAELVHSDRLLFGAAYVTVWADDYGQPTLTGDTPETMTIARDIASGEAAWAVRRVDTDDGSRAVLYRPDSVQVWTTATRDAAAAGDWKHVATLDNPLDTVPVVPFVRRLSLSDPETTGLSILDDITDLTDAIAKLLGDAMVTSEFHARPRRWATGLEIEERPVLDDHGQPLIDDDGEPVMEPVDPFGKGRFLHSESPDTKFGQLDGARLDGYSDLIATLTQQIGSLTGLPPHYLGLHGDQPPSAEAVKAAETQLVVAAYEAQRQLTDPWRTVAWLLNGVITATTPVRADLRSWSVEWQSPETRTPAQQADAALKHRQIGVPLAYVVRHMLDYPADEIDGLVADARTETALGQGLLR